MALPLCGACPIVGYCVVFLNKLLTQKKNLETRRSSWLVITPSTPRFICFQGLDLGVAMVAMVAMPSSFADFPLEVQVADVSEAGKATAGRMPPARPCTPQPHRTPPPCRKVT